MPGGSALEVTIHTAAGAAKVDGVIVWVDPPDKQTPGTPIRHGLEFIRLDWPTAVVLARVLAGRLRGQASG